MRKKLIEEFCTGCGLCTSVLQIECNINEKGFNRPSNFNYCDEIFNKICPVLSYPSNEQKINNVWGKYYSIYLGYSKNDYIRNIASSGGVLTQLAIYLLENGEINGVIHIGVSKENPLETVTYCSHSKDEIIENCGSRYATSSPLKEIDKYLNTERTYAFIGKPCDVRALRRYALVNPLVDCKIPYMFSFFCAGTPSMDANIDLIKKMGCNISDLISLSYRGNGWPGFATATDINGNEYKESYNNSWGKILGRDVQKACRFCWDGVGEEADISCGDAWYTIDEKPDFSEHEGRNVIFCRNRKGEMLLKKLIELEYLVGTDFTKNIKDLEKIQYYQFDRKATMLSKIIAMRICLKITPNYKLSELIFYSKLVPFKKHIKILIGTLRRIVQQRI